MMTAAVRATYRAPRSAQAEFPRWLPSVGPAASKTTPPFSSYAKNFSTESSLSSASSASSLAKVSKDGVVGHPIDFDINSKIEGNESQIVTIHLEPGQVLRAESGAMMYMTQGVEMNTTTG